MFNYQLHVIVVVFCAIFVQQTNGLAVSDMLHENFCTGDSIEISCPNEWQIHISTSYYVYVHGVHEAGSSCEKHHNASQQCFRKIQFYDPEYYAELHKKCQSKQKCEAGLVAKVGDPRTCWDYPHSPSDYLTFSYMCVNVDKDHPTTKYLTSQFATATTRYLTTGPPYKPSGSYIPSNPHGSSRPYSSSRPYIPSRPYISTNTRSVSRTYAPSRPYYPTVTKTPPSTIRSTTPLPTWRTTGTSPSTLSKTHSMEPAVLPNVSQKEPDMLMVIVIPISVVVMLVAIITIAAVLACRKPKKKSSVLRRRLSENSSVYYSNGDRGSISGDSVVTRASIHGITNPGFDVTEKPPVTTGYTDKVILSPNTLISNTSLHLPDIHIVPTYNNNVSTMKDESNENIYVNGTVTSVKKEPLSEQAYTEVNETKNVLKSK